MVDTQDMTSDEPGRVHGLLNPHHVENPTSPGWGRALASLGELNRRGRLRKSYSN